MATQLGLVQTQHSEYIANKSKWKLCRDVVASEVKPYLRDVGKTEKTESAQRDRQDAYEDGALFYNFTKRTIDGLVGSIFRKEATIQLTPETEYLNNNTDGNNQSLIQQSQETVKENITVGRVGLFTDVPASPVDGEGNRRRTTIEEDESLEFAPRIQVYQAENIVNWRTQRIGSVNKLVLVVLAEQYEYPNVDNEFVYLVGTQYRVLELDELGLYRQRVYRFDNAGGQIGSIQIIEPTANGGRMREIPFVFCGADNNDYTVDEPPTYPLALVNIGHYRNVADNEEQLFVASQAMLIIAPEKSIAAKWNEANPDGVLMGSRRGINVGGGGSATIIQAASTNALGEAIKQKEQQAIAIGAQLITPTQQVTAESARLQRGADTSVLSSIANNVSDAYYKCIRWCQLFLGDTGDIDFNLNTEFFLETLTSQDRMQWMADINAGLFTRYDYWAAMRRSGQTDKTDAELDKELESQGMSGDFGLTSDLNPTPEEEPPAAITDEVE